MLAIDMTLELMQFETLPLLVMCVTLFLILFFMLCVGGQVSVKSVLFSPAGWICSLQICTACYCNSSHSRCSRCSSLQRWVCKGEVSMGASLLCSGIQGALVHHSTSFPVSLSYLHAHTCMHNSTWATWMHGLSLRLPLRWMWAGTNPGLFPLLVILCTEGAVWLSPQRQKTWLALPAPCTVPLGRLFNHWVQFSP